VGLNVGAKIPYCRSFPTDQDLLGLKRGILRLEGGTASFNF
jgi:hypothetical protein